jgi:hypothetical protein
MTWICAFSHGINDPLHHMFGVAWIGIVELLYVLQIQLNAEFIDYNAVRKVGSILPCSA